jgi:hypothetical protein
MTSDVACARPLSPGSGEGQPIPGTRVRGGEESGRPIIGDSLPDPWLLIVGSWRSPAHAWSRSVTSSVLTWLELGVWLARSLPRYAVRNLSMEKTVPRDSM